VHSGMEEWRDGKKFVQYLSQAQLNHVCFTGVASRGLCQDAHAD